MQRAQGARWSRWLAAPLWLCLALSWPVALWARLSPECLLALSALSALSWAQWRGRRGWRRVALAALALVLVGRVGCAGCGSLRLEALDGEGAAGWSARLFPEQEVTTLGAWAMRLSGRARGEADALPGAMAAAWWSAWFDQGPMPSPWPQTSPWSGSPRPPVALFEVPPVERQSGLGVVFLHGYGGNFALNCQVFAEAAREAGAMTACPSLDFRGDWSQPRGRALIEASLAALRRRGATRLVLAGLSNGALGAGVHAHALRRELVGVILIAGVSQRARDPGLPLLILYGERDSMERGRRPDALVRAAGGRATARAWPDGHFFFLDHRREVQGEISRWLKNI